MLNNNHIVSKTNTTAFSTLQDRPVTQSDRDFNVLPDQGAVGIIIAIAVVIGAVAQLLKVLVPVMLDKKK